MTKKRLLDHASQAVARLRNTPLESLAVAYLAEVERRTYATGSPS